MSLCWSCVSSSFRRRRSVRQPEVRYRLKQRAKFLQTLINESRQTVFLMEHYHDHSEEGDAHADCRAV